MDIIKSYRSNTFLVAQVCFPKMSLVSPILSCLQKKNEEKMARKRTQNHQCHCCTFASSSLGQTHKTHTHTLPSSYFSLKKKARKKMNVIFISPMLPEIASFSRQILWSIRFSSFNKK